MSSKRSTAPDMRTIKRSRASYTGAVTKIKDTLTDIQPKEVSAYNVRMLERSLNSLTHAEEGFQQTVVEVQDLQETEEIGVEYDEEEEQRIISRFTDHVNEVQDLAEDLLATRRIFQGLSNLKGEAQALRDTFVADPTLNQEDSLSSMNSTFSSVKKDMERATLPSTHHLRKEVDDFIPILTRLTADLASSKIKATIATPPTLSSSFSSSDSDYDETCRIPKIDIPTFHGDIMQWASFWAQFEASIDSHERLSDVRKLVYLRKAIKDPDTRELLNTGVEKPGMYGEIVGVLKQRFDRTREIHRNHCQKLTQLGTIKSTRTDLSRFVDTARTTISSLNHSGYYTLDAFLTSTLYLNLPVKLQTLWEQQSKKDKGVPPVAQLLTFISDHAETLPANPTNSGRTPETQSEKKPFIKKTDRKQEPAHSRQRANIHVSTPAPIYKWECTLCKPEKHPLFVCSKWQAFTVAQRLSHISSKGLCSNCLPMGLNSADCRSVYKCRECNQSHHTTIHQEPPATPIHSFTPSSPTVQDALMMTALVKASGPDNQEMSARALIDSGAAMTLVTHRVARMLHLPLTKANLSFTGVQGTPCKSSHHLTTLTLSPIEGSQKKVTETAAVVQKVTDNLPVQSAPSISDLPHIQYLTLADPTYHEPGRIDILLGADAYPELMMQDAIITGPPKTPAAQNTIFGWAIVGPVTYKSSPSLAIPTNFAQGNSDQNLTDFLPMFWKTEEPESTSEALTPVEEHVQEHYVKNITYSSSNSRYKVTLPRRTDVAPLGDSRNQALNRYYSNERSILKRNVWKPFQDVVKEYLDLGHAELVPAAEPTAAQLFYLPMHSVTKQSSTTTKLRVVFDGGAVTTSGISLNKSLLVGPTLHPTLGAILMKFRTYPIAVSADISKMYREIELADADKDLHRFLWRATPQEPIQDYRMRRVTFGVSASPYLAVRTLQQTSVDHGQEHPHASYHICNSFYVDDLLAGAESVSKAVELYSSLVLPEWIEGKFSSYHQLITVTGWCQRFIYRLKHGRLPFSTMTGRHLHPQELATAEQFLVSLSQSRSFPKEVHTLTQDKPIANTSKLHLTMTSTDFSGLEADFQTHP